MAYRKEKATSPILRLVRGTTKSPLTNARSEDRAGMLATGVSRSPMYALACDRIISCEVLQDLVCSRVNL